MSQVSASFNIYIDLNNIYIYSSYIFISYGV